MKKRNVVVIDVDQTLTTGKLEGITYADVGLAVPVKARLLELKAKGYWIILTTSRNMLTYEGNIGQIIKHTAPVLLKWLAEHEIPYDEIHFGKPWCGDDGFYVDDRAIRPREFTTMSIDEIASLLDRDRSR